jgi:hypothetical protein
LRPSEVEYLDNPNARGTWAIIINWTDHDPRRARIRSGELDPTAAFDYIARYRFDCPPDQARAFFEKAVKGAAHMPEAHTLLDRVQTLEREAGGEEQRRARASSGSKSWTPTKPIPTWPSAGVGTVVSSFGGIEKPRARRRAQEAELC